MFEVSPEGFRELQAGREPWQLAKEPVSNAFDEATVSIVQVTVRKEGNEPAVLRVEDDGEGFADISDAWTLHAPTPKREDPRTRGRFNLGEKEILAVAVRGRIETTSGTVLFDKQGRTVSRKKRSRGTVIELELPWTKDQVADAENGLREIDPPSRLNYQVNGLQVKPLETIATFTAELETPLKSEGAVRMVRREAEVLVKRPRAQAWVMEMGVPVQPTDCPWTIDVQQKVPLSPNRDSIKERWLRGVYAEVLNAMVDSLPDGQESAQWLRAGSVDARCSPETVRKVRDMRYGEKVVLWSPDAVARERAEDAGYLVVHPKLLSAEERQVFREHAGLRHASEVFGLKPGDAERVKPTGPMEAFAGFVRGLGRELLGFEPRVEFYSLRNDAFCATWNGRTIAFNVHRLGAGFFESVSARQLSTVLHEFAHHGARGADGEPHGKTWKDRFETLAGRCVELALRHPGFFVLDASGVEVTA